jgi:hypothetical protein|tara:strand:+ start:950 stop:1729 length:780 start_codon:yes stop_codon:yes gene_type:complete
MNIKKNFFNKKLTPLFPGRFNLLIIEKCIEHELFIALRKNFPSDNYFENKTKFALTLPQNDKNFNLFLSDCEIWKNYINLLNSVDFKKEVIKNFKIKNVFFSDKSLKRFIPFFKKVKFEFTFNKSINESFNNPHTDSTRKIVSMIIFFTSDEWSIKNGGLVNLFKPKDNKYEFNWRNEVIEENKLEVIKIINPIPNNFYGFKKTKNSYHSVSKILCNDGESRDVLMINLSYAEPKDVPYTDKTFFVKIYQKIVNIFNSK